MAEILQIIQLGDPLLRAKAQFVENIRDNRIQKLIDDLVATVGVAFGVGIAAPQVASCDRLCLLWLPVPIPGIPKPQKWHPLP